MFVDVETSDGPVTVKLDNIFFERHYDDLNYVRMSITGHKDYWCKQPGRYQSWEHKSYDYSVSWKEYNRIRALMGLARQHLRGCNLDEGIFCAGSCECFESGYSMVKTEGLNKIKDLACNHLNEHPPEIKIIDDVC